MEKEFYTAKEYDYMVTELNKIIENQKKSCERSKEELGKLIDQGLERENNLDKEIKALKAINNTLWNVIKIIGGMKVKNYND